MSAPRTPNAGTPRDLREVMKRIHHEAAKYFFTPEKNGEEKLHQQLHHIMTDFLAQRFGAAMLMNPEAGEVLQQLFNDLTRE